MMYLGNQAVGIATSLPIFSDIAKVDCGIYTAVEDTDVSTLWLSHSLGVEPDFILCQSNMTSSTPNQSSTNLIFSTIFKTDMFNQYYGQPDSYIFVMAVKGISRIGTKMASLCSDDNHNSAEFFRFPFDSSLTFTLKGGITYNYILGKFKEVTPNA